MSQEKIIEVIATRKLEKKEVEEIKNLFGKDAEIKMTLDPDILGGVIIRYGDDYFDGSVRGQLEKLKQKIIS